MLPYLFYKRVRPFADMNSTVQSVSQVQKYIFKLGLLKEKIKIKLNNICIKSI